MVFLKWMFMIMAERYEESGDPGRLKYRRNATE